MFPLTPKLYALAAVALILLGLTVALKVQTARLHACQDEFSAFVTKVKAEGEAQEQRTKAENLKHQKEKEDADKKFAAADTELKRLRATNSGRRDLPGTGPDTKGVATATTCYASAELDRAYGVLVQDLRGVADEGARCAEELRVAREWAQGR